MLILHAFVGHRSKLYSFLVAWEAKFQVIYGTYKRYIARLQGLSSTINRAFLPSYGMYADGSRQCACPASYTE